MKVALNAPLPGFFDYVDDMARCVPGQRVRVPFGRSHRVGIVVSIASSSDVPADKLKAIAGALDDEPLVDARLMELLRWASAYYQHPVGEVFATALPVLLRKGEALPEQRIDTWSITEAGRTAAGPELERRAPRQSALLERLADAGSCTAADLVDLPAGWRQTAKTLADKGWVAHALVEPTRSGGNDEIAAGPELTSHQQRAVSAITDTGFASWLLEGVTGSGKTEVYLRLTARQLEAGRQVLVLVPEIGLTPQLVSRFRSRFGDTVASLHSGLNDSERALAWEAARRGDARIVVGTRSAVFTPFADLGLIVVDEEHDGSFKQQDGFRYSARDVAVARAKLNDIPVVLGSATPSFETMANADAGRYERLELPERAGGAEPPSLKVVDIGRHGTRDGLSPPLIDAMREQLAAGNQVLLYLNRRGFAPSLLCTDCGKVVECTNCDARMVFHQKRNVMSCHHCGRETRTPDTCADCEGPLKPIGQGTERVEQALTELFPDAPMVRIDRDTTRRKGAMEALLADIRAGRSRILLGTQMLTKGHDFPNVTLVGILDADQGLFGTDFRSSERLAQAFVQVAGRAGRGERRGQVIVQTLCPDHPLLLTLLSEGYRGFTKAALEERQAAQWPPFSHLALLRAEASDRNRAHRFLEQAADALSPLLAGHAARILGPASATMEKRQGRYRAQLLVQAENRPDLQALLAGWRPLLEELPDARPVRWSLDVDPAELI